MDKQWDRLHIGTKNRPRNTGADVGGHAQLIGSDKEGIVRIAIEMGTQEFAANMSKYCGVISVSPTTRASLERIEAYELNFDMSILDRAIGNAEQTRIDELAEGQLSPLKVYVP